jgi:hypothetical protein
MSIFGNIMDRIFRHHSATAAQAAAPAQASAPQQGGGETMTAPPPAQTQQVDVGAVLAQMAAEKGGGGNYQSSIVDLLKLLGLDSSLQARDQLANELNVHVGPNGSAEENIALHKAVMNKLAENGGKVPQGWLQ